jgi:hypothetical protein
MTKTTGKTDPEGQPSAGPSQDEIRNAYEIHTLAQMLYGQLAMTHPWIATMPPARGFDPVASFQPTPWTQGGPGMWNVGPVSHPFTVPHPIGLEMYPH